MMWDQQQYMLHIAQWPFMIDSRLHGTEDAVIDAAALRPQAQNDGLVQVLQFLYRCCKQMASHQQSLVKMLLGSAD